MVIIDQLTKVAVKGFSLWGFEHQGLFYGESIPVLGTFLQFTFVENPGMAFGISFGPFKIFLSLFSVFASIALAWYLYKIKNYDLFVRIGIALILAGAVGNLIDRVFYGVIFGGSPLFYGLVVDFIQVDIPDINIGNINYSHWPVFNIADSCVSVGVVLLLIFNKRIPSLKDIRSGSSVPAEIEKKINLESISENNNNIS